MRLLHLNFVEGRREGCWLFTQLGEGRCGKNLALTMLGGIGRGRMWRLTGASDPDHFETLIDQHCGHPRGRLPLPRIPPLSLRCGKRRLLVPRRSIRMMSGLLQLRRLSQGGTCGVGWGSKGQVPRQLRGEVPIGRKQDWEADWSLRSGLVYPLKHTIIISSRKQPTNASW